MRNIVTHGAYQKHIKEEISRVHLLTGTNLSIWNIRNQPKGALLENDSIKLIPGCGGKKGQALIAVGVTTIAFLKYKSDADLLLLTQSIPGISLVSLTKWQSTTPSPGSSSGGNKDYRKYPNPYLEKYGPDEREE